MIISFLKINLRLSLILACFGLILLSFLPSLELIDLQILKKPFQLICHSTPNRCFSINGMPSLLCVRCTCIYFFVGLGLLINCHVKHTSRILLGSLFFIFLDVFLERIHVYENIFLTRIITGAMLGLALSFVILKSRVKN